MKKRMYVMLPCKAHHKQWLREAAADRCELVFADEAAPENFAGVTAVFGEPSIEAVLQMPDLEWIQLSWAGADRYTKSPDYPKHVLLSCASGAYGGTIAEYMFGTILAMYRNLPRYVRQMDQGLWQPKMPSCGIEGKTVLILGAGNIGSEFAKRLRPFGAKIIGVRRVQREVPPEFDEMHTLSELPELLKEADIVACSLPNTPDTIGLLDETMLRTMKPNALLVNVGRGTLVNPDVLAKVLQSGYLYGAILDVADPEPLPADHPLWKMENVLITPHVAGVGFGNVPETEDKIIRLGCDNLVRYLNGEKLAALVDFQTGYRAL